MSTQEKARELAKLHGWELRSDDSLSGGIRKLYWGKGPRRVEGKFGSNGKTLKVTLWRADRGEGWTFLRAEDHDKGQRLLAELARPSSGDPPIVVPSPEEIVEAAKPQFFLQSATVRQLPSDALMLAQATAQVRKQKRRAALANLQVAQLEKRLETMKGEANVLLAEKVHALYELQQCRAQLLDQSVLVESIVLQVWGMEKEIKS